MIITNGSSLSSALYVVDLKKFRKIAAGDRLRGQYQGLSQDPNSLSNLDQVSGYFLLVNTFGDEYTILCQKMEYYLLLCSLFHWDKVCFFIERNFVCAYVTFVSVLRRRHTSKKCHRPNVGLGREIEDAAFLNYYYIFSFCTQANLINLFLCLLGHFVSFFLGANYLSIHSIQYSITISLLSVSEIMIFLSLPEPHFINTKHFSEVRL